CHLSASRARSRARSASRKLQAFTCGSRTAIRSRHASITDIAVSRRSRIALTIVRADNSFNRVLFETSASLWVPDTSFIGQPPSPAGSRRFSTLHLAGEGLRRVQGHGAIARRETAGRKEQT